MVKIGDYLKYIGLSVNQFTHSIQYYVKDVDNTYAYIADNNYEIRSILLSSLDRNPTDVSWEHISVTKVRVGDYLQFVGEPDRNIGANQCFRVEEIETSGPILSAVITVPSRDKTKIKLHPDGSFPNYPSWKHLPLVRGSKQKILEVW